MNHVIAQGSPNSLIRRFQDNPHLGVDLLEILKRIRDNALPCKRTGAALENIRGIAIEAIRKFEY